MRILIIRFSSLGDIVLTSGIIKYINDNFPEAIVDVLTYTDYADLWNNNGKVFHVKKGIKIFDFHKFLKTMPEYSNIYDLHCNLRSKIACIILKGKKYKYSKQSLQRRLFVKFRMFKNELEKHVTQKYAEAILPSLNLKVPALEELRPYYENKFITNPDKIVIHPFASRSTKIWTGFSDLASELVKQGYEVFFIGKNNINLNGVKKIQTETLAELIEFMSDARLVISSDSGPMHIAIALQRALVAIFCSTTKELGFYPSFKGCHVIEKKLRCRPCSIHGLNTCPLKHFECSNISVDKALGLISSILLENI